MTHYLTDIARAVIASEARFESKNDKYVLPQISDIRRVASINDGAFCYYVVTGVTFRKTSAYQFHYAVEAIVGGEINCRPEHGARNAEAACYMLADVVRARISEGV